MSSLTKVTHETKVREVARGYESQGFQVIIKPESEAVPFKLGSYQPDLIAQKEDQHLIVEVKTDVDRISVDRFRSIAQEVMRHPGWRFLLVTPNDVEAGSWSGTSYELASSAEVSERVSRAERQLDEGNGDAAFFLMWSAFEASLRRHAAIVAIPIDRLPTLALLKHLYSQGEISIPQFDRAMTALRLRDRMAQGFATPDFVPAAADLRSLIKELESEWAQSDPA